MTGFAFAKACVDMGHLTPAKVPCERDAAVEEMQL